MIEFTVTTDIARPASEVFAFVTDPAKLATWQTNTVSATPEPPGPLKLGSRLREVHRAPGGKQLESLVEVSEYQAGTVFALKMIEGALPLDARISFEAPQPDSTRMHFTVSGEPKGAMRLAQPLLRRTLKRQFSEFCATLKALLEE